MKDLLRKLPGALLPWYQQNKRDLPWRGDRQPYHVWLSEIMLQQTRVEAVKGYYARFLGSLPTVESLANCDDEMLHKLWEGLGYYSRVRNLKKAAQVIMDQYAGEFPGEYKAVLALPGIGEYTAGAICSICFDAPTPAVDGNVLRVISRLTDDSTSIDKPAFRKAITESLSAVYPDRAGDFTQALMELGATVCGPNRKPDCENCPCKTFCLGFARGTAEELPVKKAKPQRRIEEKTVLILSCDGFYALHKRPDKGLLAGLWEFPNLSGKLELPEADVVNAMDAIAAPVSLYDPIYSDGGDPLTVMDQVRDHQNTDEKWLERMCLRSAFEGLEPREKQILSLRFYDGKTQTQVAGILGISQAQVSRLEKGAIGTMRKSFTC